MPTRDEDDALPPKVLAAAEELRKREGVLGVFWGDRYKESEGRWIPERTLCVHVQKKRPMAELAEKQRIHSTFRGFSVDILEVGYIRAHAIGAADEVVADGGLRRSSAITAIKHIKGIPYALVSGHGTLPLNAQNRIPNLYSGSSSSGDLIELQDDFGTKLVGRLLRGKLGKKSSIDYALAVLKCNSNEIDPRHGTAERSPPFKIGMNEPSDGATLTHYSRVIGAFRHGTFRRVAVGPFDVVLPDGSTHQYTNAFVIASNDGMKFSVPGDSGSLVVDENHRVVGTVLGGNTVNPITYVLPARSLTAALTSEEYTEFFLEQ